VVLGQVLVLGLAVTVVMVMEQLVLIKVLEMLATHLLAMAVAVVAVVDALLVQMQQQEAKIQPILKVVMVVQVPLV
jgi:hypothetical protein